MTLYVDRLNGVWGYNPMQGISHPWRLISKSNHFDHRDFLVDSQQNHASVKFLGPFRRFSVGEEFDFPAEYNRGDKVWIDGEWFESDAVGRTVDWVGSPIRIGGVVTQEPDCDDLLKVNVEIYVPVSVVASK